jgi:hypothetical protein
MGNQKTFSCASCERDTRNPDHGGTELCRECRDLWLEFNNEVSPARRSRKNDAA